MAGSSHLIDPSAFLALQEKIEDDTKVRDKIRDAVQELEKNVKFVHSVLSTVHSSASAPDETILSKASEAISPMLVTIKRLDAIASNHPFYKFNQSWSMKMQDASFAIVLYVWLGGSLPGLSEGGSEGKLLGPEDVGKVMQVPVNLKDRDAFHLTLEEYLHSLISLIEELARLARNSVTLGNYKRPVLISQFIKELHSGFQVLNLKNDALRRRSDSIKYRVGDVEGVIYDLSLRGLIEKP